MGCGGSKEQSAPKQPTSPTSPPQNAENGQPGSPKQAAQPGQVKKPQESGGVRIVMGKYHMLMDKESIMGEGTSSICRKGKVIATGDPVAIKVYKEQRGKNGKKQDDVTLQKYRRQISVLTELQEPWKKPSDPTLWSEQLNNIKPSRIFMQLLDYSKQADGQPGPDPDDGVIYVVTELAQYSLKDFLAQRREQSRPLSTESIKNVSKAIVLAMAGLAAKGFVHLDMKPENMMMFNGRLKVIDVDGCVRVGTKVSISDSSISFSPCYCAPEWARFLIQDSETSIVASPLLDSWSVGMTICELVTLDAILKPMYANFLRNAHSHREAGFLFMEWLGGLKKAQLPKQILKLDPAFVQLLTQGLLVATQAQRKTCAQCLQLPYIAEGGWPHDPGAGKSGQEAEGPKLDMPQEAPRIQRLRPEDDSTAAPLHKGTLWKLNQGGDANNKEHWIKRDMWIAHNHSLCYYSKKENKRLVLIDGTKLQQAMFEPSTGHTQENAFKIKISSDEEGVEPETYHLAAESKDELDQWMKKLKQTGKMELLVTMKLGKQMQDDLVAFRIAVKNRRMKVEDDEKAQFEPVFKAKLWKLKGEGDAMKNEDWFLREMWISKNGCLVYYSPKEERELIYYTAADLSRAKVAVVDSSKTMKPYAFQVILPPANGVEFAPGDFAAETEEQRNKWMAEFKKMT
mmetsp:Transcript_11962/g.21913  ORF Transcript_11962/g.21913 Transcript_11962/m.21913 type:complete len:682 (+) Transcript_11962:128-2173(+)